MVLNVLSLDVEEWYQVYNLRNAVSRKTWDEQCSRVEASTRRFMDLLEVHGSHATFFVLGWVAERHPDLIRDIVARGHEVASHGYAHDLLTELDATRFADDLARTEAILEPLTGSRPVGYRAPSFTVMPGTRWALDVLHERGYRYDSSLFPVSGRRYGFPGAPRRPHVIRRNGDRVLWSLPLLTRRWLGRNWPMAGGGYLRLFPVTWTAAAVRTMNRAGWPAMVYLHPWELDPDQPRPAGVSRRKRFQHTVNLRRTAAKLTFLLERFRFSTAARVVDALSAERPELLEEPVPGVLLD